MYDDTDEPNYSDQITKDEYELDSQEHYFLF